MSIPTKRQYPFELKLAIVERFLAGETKASLAREDGMSAPKLIEAWARIYRREGEAGLRRKPKDRRPGVAASPVAQSELVRLRRENQRLTAENVYLGKLAALIAEEQQ